MFRKRTVPVSLSVGAAIEDDEKNLLLVGQMESVWEGTNGQGGNKYVKKLAWGLPSGHVKPEETFVEALKREVLEEVGLEIEIISLIRIYELWDERSVFFWQKRRRRIAWVFRAKAIGGEPKTRDNKIKELRWFPWVSFQRDVIEIPLRKPPINRLAIQDWASGKEHSAFALYEIPPSS